MGKVDKFLNENGDLVFYIINYENSKGYTLVSSDRRMTPILSHNDSGYFDKDNLHIGIEIWLSIVKEAFIEIRKLSKPDKDIESKWKKFESDNAKTRQMSIICPPPPNNIIVEHLTDNLSQWSQGAGYNYYSPARNNSSCDCQKSSAGCGPVATAQMLRYHRRTLNFNGTVFTQNDFDTMPRSLPNNCNLFNSNDISVAWLIRSAGEEINASYQIASNCQTAVLTPSNIVDFFNRMGFQSNNLHFYSNVQHIDNEIINRRPVILYGSTCGACIWNAHIWILDGIRKTYWYDVVTTYDPQIGYEDFCELNSFTEYQMNWGWGNANGAWFTINNFGFNNIYNNSNMRAYTVQ